MITKIPGVHSELLPDVLNALDRLESRYPGIPYSVDSKWFLHSGPLAGAETNPDTGEVVLSRFVFRNPAAFDLWNNGEETVTRSPGDVIRHEWGHVLLPYIHPMDMQKALVAMRDIVIPFTETMPRGLTYEDVERDKSLLKIFPISFYAMQGGPIECLAECFCKLERGDDDKYVEIAELAYGSLRVS